MTRTCVGFFCTLFIVTLVLSISAFHTIVGIIIFEVLVAKYLIFEVLLCNWNFSIIIMGFFAVFIDLFF